MTEAHGTPPQAAASEPASTPALAPEPQLVAPDGAAPQRFGALPWLSLVGFLILAVAIALAWAYPRRLPAPPPPPSVSPAALAALSTRLAALEQKLATLPPPPDLAPLEARLAALENRPLPGSAPSDQAALSRRITALDTSLGDLSARLARLERLVRAQAAATALAEGRPLGTLPGAPAALARFATTAPPTLASLRLSFPEAARAERAASRPATAGKPLIQRLLLQAGNLVTLRSGNRVIIGNPADATLVAARAALDAGDLQAALTALASLSPPLAPPMAEWEERAKALLAARAALTKRD